MTFNIIMDTIPRLNKGCLRAAHNIRRKKMVDKACNNEKCMKHEECARYEAWLKGDQNYKTFKGNEQKGCGQFIQKK